MEYDSVEEHLARKNAADALLNIVKSKIEDGDKCQVKEFKGCIFPKCQNKDVYLYCQEHSNIAHVADMITDHYLDGIPLEPALNLSLEIPFEEAVNLNKIIQSAQEQIRRTIVSAASH